MNDLASVAFSGKTSRSKEKISRFMRGIYD